MTYRDYLPPRAAADGTAVFPLRRPSIDPAAQTMSARSAKTAGLGPQDASVVPERHAPNIFVSLFQRLIGGSTNAR